MPLPNQIEGGIARLGSDSSDGLMYKPVRLPRKNKGSVLHQGEIVQGTILRSIGEEEVEVKLPLGNMTAVVHGKLQKGDTLFFKVLETIPSLILKIHSISVKVNGRVLTTDDILRSLNLPSSRLFTGIADYFRKHRSVVCRDDLMIAVRLFSPGPDTDESRINISEQRLRVAFYLVEAASASGKGINKIKNVFIDEKDYQSLLDFLEKNLVYLPAGVRPYMEKFFSTIKEPAADIIHLTSFISRKSNKDRSHFYTLLLMLVDIAKENKLPGSLASVINELAGVPDSQDEYNMLASQYSLPLMYLIPVAYGGKFRIGRLMVRKSSSSSMTNEIYKLLITLDTDEFGLLTAKAILEGDSLDFTIITQNIEMKDKLGRHLPKIREFFIAYNYIIHSIQIIPDTDGYREVADFLGNMQPRISYVI